MAWLGRRLQGRRLTRVGWGRAEEALETFEKAVYIVEQIYDTGNHPDWALTVPAAAAAAAAGPSR